MGTQMAHGIVYAPYIPMVKIEITIEMRAKLDIASMIAEFHSTERMVTYD